MPDGKGDDWNFRILLSQCIFDNIGYELTSEKLVLPLLYTTLGGPIVFAGLIFPIVRGAKLAIQIPLAPVIRAARRNKWYSAAALFTIAAVLAVICVGVYHVPAAWVVAFFLLVAIVLGASDGLNGLAFTDMLGRVLPEHRRSALLFAQSGVGGMTPPSIRPSTKAIASSRQSRLPSAGGAAEHARNIAGREGRSQSTRTQPRAIRCSCGRKRRL